MPVPAILQPALRWFRSSPAPKATKGALFSEQAFDSLLNQLTQMADPDEILRRAGVTRTSLRALTGDDEITTAMDTRRETLLAVPWRLEVEGADSAREEYPEHIQWLWAELEKHAEKVIRSCMEALAFGYSVQEAVYADDPETGRITWGEITEKPFEWFIPKLDGSVLYKSRAHPLGEPVDPIKFFLTVRNQTYRQPYGEALFSRLYWPWYFRQQGWRFWVRWLERFGTPLLVGHTDGDAKQMAELLGQVANNAAVAVGAQDTVEIASTTTGSGHFEGFERACCARIQKLVLGQTLTTDSGGSSGKSGSYALGEVHEKVRMQRRDSDIRLVRRTVQRMVDALWELNRRYAAKPGDFAKDPPTFILADDSGLEMDRAERDAKLAQAGIVKFKPPYLMRVYDFEPADLDVEAMERANEPPPALPVPGQGPAPRPKPGTKAAALFAADPKFTPEQQAIEDPADAVLERLGDVIADAEIKAAIRASATREDLVESLTALLAHLPAREFRQTLEHALFAADLMGYAHAQTERPTDG